LRPTRVGPRTKLLRSGSCARSGSTTARCRLSPQSRHFQEEKAFFIFSFAKNERANISSDELRALKFLAKELLNYSAMSLTKALQTGELIEIEVNDDG